MNKDNMHFATRKSKIYKDIYRHSSLSSFLRTIISVILVGQSPVGSPDHHYSRKIK